MEISDIKLLEIELHSYCNRQCPWCPNSFIDRKSTTKYLDSKVLNNLLRELKEKQFKGVISLSRYNEPFAVRTQIRFFLKLKDKYLPDIKVVANTNGDYKFEDFKDVIEITEMDYDNIKTEKTEGNFRIMKLKNVNNRGGVLPNIDVSFKRDFPCYEPSLFVGINYDGTVSPCCNIRNDIEEHKPYILGDLNNNSLDEILNTPKALKFRNNVSNCNFDKVCLGCSKRPGRYTSGIGIRGEQS